MHCRVSVLRSPTGSGQSISIQADHPSYHLIVLKRRSDPAFFFTVSSLVHGLGGGVQGTCDNWVR